MNKYDGSGGDDQSEDGLLKSPDNDLLSNEEDTTDSLDIKPPQASKGETRYKVKKSSKDKKHSRDDRLKDRDRINERGEHREQRHHGGERVGVDNRHHGIKTATGKVEREQIRYETAYMHQHREREHYSNHKVRVNIRDKFKTREQHKLDKGLQRSHDRKKNSPEKSESDRALEDLRSRLLSKRNKLETEKRAEDQRILINENHYEYRRIEKDINYEYEIERRKEKDSLDKRNEYYQHISREHRERKDIIELIDSPENYNDIPSQSKMLQKDNRHGRTVLATYTEDREQAARRSKLLEAEREMARRKILFREELEARRELRRERNETRKSNPSIASEKKRKRQISYEDVKEYKKVRDNDLLDIDKDYVVAVTDNSEEDTESDTTTNSESKDLSDGEIPGSPLSIGELTKSDLRRRSNSRSISRSRSHSISSQSRSRSVSRSKSTSPNTEQYRKQSLLYNSNSQSPLHSRSKSGSPNHQLREDYDNFKGDENVNRNIKISTTDNSPIDVENKETKDNSLSNIEEKEVLPSYFPALQGCRSVEEFQRLNRIEEGTYGVVYRAKDKRTEEIVALKRLKMEKEREGFPITSLREINTLLKGQHPNIVTVREIVVGSNVDKIYIVMDYVEHDLKSLMETMKHKKQAFLPGEVKCLLQQLLRAVAHLHDNWILHRDLKTSNLLLSHKGILKVGDFGLAREYGSPLKAYTSIVVTLWYRAPELLLCCKEYSTPIDIWSVGCIFAELMSMTALFPGKSEIDQLNRIFKDLGTPNDKIWLGYNELPAVQKMTFTEYPVSQLRKKFSHLTSELGLSLLQGLLTYDPKQRLTADKGLRHNYFKELPLPIDPGMFPTWPAKSELGVRSALASSPKPPSGGGQFKKLVDEGSDNHGFNLGTTTLTETRQIAIGGGFSLKF